MRGIDNLAAIGRGYPVKASQLGNPVVIDKEIIHDAFVADEHIYIVGSGVRVQQIGKWKVSAHR